MSWVEIEHVDGLPVRGATLDDLDFARLRRHLETARPASENIRERDPLDYLARHQGIIEMDGQQVPTLGALLCFGHDPQRHLPFSGIALTRYSSSTPNSQQVLDIRDIRGTLFELIDQAESYLWNQSLHGFRIDSGPRRIALDQYPRPVLRELVVNAIAHRDYRVTGSRVKIEMFRNVIEWASPGGLPPGVTVQNILKSQYTRNPCIVNFLWDAGYIEQRGMGLDSVVNTLASLDLPYPEMEDTGSSFLIRVEGLGSVDKIAEASLPVSLAQIYTLVESAGAEGLAARSIAERLSIPLRTVNSRLRDLIAREMIIRQGATNQTRYIAVASEG